MARASLALPFLILAPLSQASAAEEFPEDVRTIRHESSLDGSSQPALFLPAPGKEPAPLVVSLHSWSADYRQTMTAAIARECRERGWGFLQPDFRGPNRRAEACGSELAVTDILDAVRHARKISAVDPRRIYLVGSSGGGHMALLMAGRAPEVWAAVSSWVPIGDLVAWHRECTLSGRKYAAEIEAGGGKPGTSPEVDRQYRQRSPLTHLAKARGLPIDIHAGIRDGHDGSVPVSHSLRAFNVLAREKDRLTSEEIEAMTRKASVPPSLAQPAGELADAAYGKKRPLFRRRSGAARVTIFDGGHETVIPPIFEFFEGKARARPNPEKRHLTERL